MKTILTKEEIDYWVGSNGSKAAVARAIEQAILEKIGEAVAWRGHSGNLAYSKDSLMPSVRHLATPLYSIPFIEVEE